ncbi:MAG TPA: carboxypeptidase-like regulatory domain-containing protein, partial [Longimicrobium sp.]
MRHAATIAIALLVGAADMAYAQRTPGQGTRTGAQAPQGEGTIRGAVVDAAGQPIRSASAEVRSAADSSLVTGTLTGADGSFRIQGLRPGRYYLRVSALGHTTTTRGGIAITPAAAQAEVGTIRLTAAAVALEGLTVTAERREASLAP